MTLNMIKLPVTVSLRLLINRLQSAAKSRRDAFVKLARDSTLPISVTTPHTSSGKTGCRHCSCSCQDASWVTGRRLKVAFSRWSGVCYRRVSLVTRTAWTRFVQNKGLPPLDEDTPLRGIYMSSQAPRQLSVSISYKLPCRHPDL